MHRKSKSFTMPLSNFVHLPSISYGTYKVQCADVKHLLDAALRAGYRSIDTAEGYRNEAAIGAALAQLLPSHELSRQDVFITSKLAPRSHGYENCLKAVERSLEALQTDYIDMYLIHWPGAMGRDPASGENPTLRAASWRALEKLLSAGTLRAIGVSNYTTGHLSELLSSCTVAPHVNQVECHPYYQQRELRQFCQQHNIHLQAYSSLGTTVAVSALLTDRVVGEVATEVQRSPAQVLLRWALQQGISVIPKSTNPAHIGENVQLDFPLSDQQMSRLETLECNTKFAWNPQNVT